MGFNFQFRLAEDRKDFLRLESFLLEQPLNYPHYEDWVVGSREEFLSGHKRCIFALSEEELVGNLVSQQHKQFSKVMELKNMRVHSKLRGRYFGFFMLRQAEAESKKYDAIICDTRSDQLPVINLLRICGYEELLRVPLYEKNVEDVVMVKKFERTPTGFFVPIKQKIILNVA